MQLYEILLISVGLSLDVFAYSLWKGSLMPEVKTGNLLKLVGIFCAWQMVSIYLGKLVANIPVFKSPHGVITTRWGYLSVVLFIAIGIYMIFKGSNSQLLIERVEENINYREVVVWNFVTSFNAFIAGIGFALFKVSLKQVIFVHGIVVAICVIAGTYAGYRLGGQSKNKVVTVGGCLLLIGAVELLVQRLL